MSMGHKKCGNVPFKEFPPPISFYSWSYYNFLVVSGLYLPVFCSCSWANNWPTQWTLERENLCTHFFITMPAAPALNSKLRRDNQIYPHIDQNSIFRANGKRRSGYKDGWGTLNCLHLCPCHFFYLKCPSPSLPATLSNAQAEWCVRG